MDSYICNRCNRCSLLWPFCQLEAWACKNVAKTRVFPFSRVIKTVKVKVRDGQIARLMRLHHRIGRAFDAALHAKGAQPVADQRGLARAQVSVQRGIGIAQLGQGRQLLCKTLSILFVAPDYL